MQLAKDLAQDGFFLRLTPRDDTLRLWPIKRVSFPIQVASPSLPTASNAEANEVHNQKESDGVTWTNKTDTQAVDCAHVQSQVSGKMHGCFNLTSMDNVNTVMNGLKQSQNDLDTRLKSRLAKISLVAEQKTDAVIQATKKEQQRLLAYDRIRQRRQHELHQEWLQKYLVELDKWRAQELAQLQQELLGHQKIIVAIAQKKIQRINDEANQRKDQALEDEKVAAARRNARLTEAMFSVERNHQYLGSEVRSEIHVRVQANVGRIAPGQACTNDFPNEGTEKVVTRRRN